MFSSTCCEKRTMQAKGLMGGVVREEGFGPGARSLGLKPGRVPRPQGTRLLPGQAHTRGTTYLVKPPGKGHNVGGETMFLLLTPSTAGEFLGRTESVSTVILPNQDTKHTRGI